MPATRNVAVLLFLDVELLDFAGPFEVFSVASRWSDPPAFSVYTVAEKPGPVVAKNGLSVNPHHLLADCPAPDVLVVPGGLGTRKEMNNAGLVGWIGRAAAKAEVVLSVCTGALLLAKAGLVRREVLPVMAFLTRTCGAARTLICSSDGRSAK